MGLKSLVSSYQVKPQPGDCLITEDCVNTLHSPSLRNLNLAEICLAVIIDIMGTSARLPVYKRKQSKTGDAGAGLGGRHRVMGRWG